MVHACRVGGRRRWALALAGLAACAESSSAPEPDCDWLVGASFVELEPTPASGFGTYEVNVGDSIRLDASLRRVDAAEATFNIQQGWYCVTVASSPLSGVVGFSTTDTPLVRLGPGGWIIGLRPGFATVMAASTDPPVTADIGVLVYSP